MNNFILVLTHYLKEVIPALAFGFLLSGVVHEFVPENWVEKHLGNKGFPAILSATIIGAILPICCWGALPVAISFYKKGARLGPIFAFLVATPATSISALLVTYNLLGPKFAIYIFFAVIFMGIIAGLAGNALKFKEKNKNKEDETCPHCGQQQIKECCEHKRGIFSRMKSILKFAFIEMPREIGLETLLGIFLAAIVATVTPIGLLIKKFLGNGVGYIFSLIFGLIMYICSTAAVPLVDAFIKQGLSVGAGMTLLLVGPITSYGTIFVIKKEFGLKVLMVYLLLISALSLVFGYLFGIVS